MTEALRLAQRVIDLAEGDPTKGNLVMGSALALAIAMRGFNRLCLGINGWRSDADVAITMAAVATQKPTCRRSCTSTFSPSRMVPC